MWLAAALLLYVPSLNVLDVRLRLTVVIVVDFDDYVLLKPCVVSLHVQDDGVRDDDAVPRREYEVPAKQVLLVLY